MDQGRIPEEIPTYFAPETYPGFFYIVARRVKKISAIKTTTIIINHGSGD